MKKEDEPVLDYPAAARAIALHLQEYCDETLPYTNMIAEAARRAMDEIGKYKDKLDSITTILEHDPAQ